MFRNKVDWLILYKCPSFGFKDICDALLYKLTQYVDGDRWAVGSTYWITLWRGHSVWYCTCTCNVSLYFRESQNIVRLWCSSRAPYVIGRRETCTATRDWYASPLYYTDLSWHRLAPNCKGRDGRRVWWITNITVKVVFLYTNGTFLSSI